VLEHLIPFHKKHSISEVVLSLHLAHPLLKLDRFEKLLSTSLKDEFQEFIPIRNLSVKINQTTEGPFNVSSEQEEWSGFQIKKFKDGKLNWLIQYVNNNLSFHCLDPDYDWETFKPSTLKFLKVFYELDPSIFLNGVSLNYVDQFSWVEDLALPLEHIFDTESEHLPRRFFQESTLNIQLSFQMYKLLQKITFLEKFEIQTIKVNPKLSNLNIVHFTYVDSIGIQPLQDFCKQDGSMYLDAMHGENKSFLKSIFTQEVCNLIHLN